MTSSMLVVSTGINANENSLRKNTEVLIFFSLSYFLLDITISILSEAHLVAMWMVAC